MATTRTTAPPVNLKDRIAALQQRSNASAHGDGLSTPSVGPGSLRAKIASFERQGAVPTPRGRFGAGAPPVGDSSSKKKGELYGNRVPELAKPSPDGALEARKRTLSSNSRSRSLSRPTSPESELASGSDPAPPLPSVTRRIVSDVLPHTQTSLTGPSINVNEVSSAGKTAVKASPPPAVVVQTDLKASTSRTSTAEAPEDAISTSFKNDDEPNGGTSPAHSVKSQETIKAAPLSNTSVQEVSKGALSQTAATQSPTDDAPSAIRATKPTSLPLSRSTSSSDSDDATASSDSVPTPSDNGAFPISESPKVEVPSIVLPTVGQSVKAIKEPLVKQPTPVVSTIGLTTPSSSPDAPVPPDSPGVMKVGRKATPSFHAVVHRKVRETVLPEPAPVMPPPSRVPLAQPKTPAVSRVRAESVAEPLSPGLGDLAALMFDAALLEEQLSGTSAAAKKSAPPPPPPTFNVEPAIPEHIEAEIVKAAPVEEEKEPIPEAPCPPAVEEVSLPPAIEEPFLPPVIEERSLPAAPEIVPPVRRESIPTPRVFTTRDSLPSRDSSVRQSVLRKQSLSRNSVYSEMSEESHVMVSRPSSPPYGSDASSVRSSSKSWKDPRKSIGRASSWLFRNKSKNSTVVVEEDTGSSDAPQSPSLLSPFLSGSVRSTSGSTSSRRPSSRMSVSSGGSGDMFDTELVSSFPSVPSNHAAPHLRSRTLPSTPPLPPLPTDFAQPVGRAVTVGHASGRQQQHLL